jgi:acetyl/propionyl-CoA carboxylase alpha subunit
MAAPDRFAERSDSSCTAVRCGAAIQLLSEDCVAKLSLRLRLNRDSVNQDCDSRGAVAPRPGAPPFVDVGAMVEPKTTIGIIEIMKLVNAVPAGVAGEVREVCVGDGDPVEYDQVLMAFHG